MTIGEFREKTKYVSDDTLIELYVEFYDYTDDKTTVGGECNSVFSNDKKVFLFREIE